MNGMGTAIMVLGSEGARALLKDQPAVQALVVNRDHSVWQTPGMAALLQTT